MKQFSLEEYLKNPDKKVITRDGKPARIICTDKRGNKPVVALILAPDNKIEVPFFYTSNGFFYKDGRDDCDDLMFASIKKEGWVNVYKHPDLEYPSCVCIYPTYEEAVSHGKIQEGYVTTTKIEWEE